MEIEIRIEISNKKKKNLKKRTILFTLHMSEKNSYLILKQKAAAKVI